MSKLIDCPDCLGMGGALKRRGKRSLTFSLKEPCVTCAGTGKALVKRNVLYVGRPDLPKAAAS